MLKIALTKGRTEKQVIPLLEKSGVDCSGLLNKKRRLIVSVADKYQFVLAKGPDVMTYLTNGACDIGIVGSDILEEQGRTENQLLDLNVGKCRFILASTSSFDPKEERRKVIGTKYPKITQRYFESIGEDVEIVKIEGSVELAPLVGLADAIVDLTETGTTLKENNLEIYEELGPISTRLVANPISLKQKKHEIFELVDALENVCGGFE